MSPNLVNQRIRSAHVLMFTFLARNFVTGLRRVTPNMLADTVMSPQCTRKPCWASVNVHKRSFTGALQKTPVWSNVIKEGETVAEHTWPTRKQDKNTGKYDWFDLKTSDIFKNKRVVVFSLPGAFTPTCSSKHLPRYEELYNEIKASNVDDVYCMSVNDSFVMNSWGEQLGVENVKLIPDGNGTFTNSLGLLVNKSQIGFGDRSWRFAMVLNDMKVEKLFIEPSDTDSPDPFIVSDAETMLKYLKSK